jgi:geranylgeranyl pyrophosphate synthase
MDIEEILKKKATLIDAAIARWIPRQYDQQSLDATLGKPRYQHSPEAINAAIAKPIWDLLDRGGKRWRPALFLIIVEALGKNSEEFVDFAIIPEVIHNGTLMIDDIEDNSELRRGKPCVHKLFGVDVAINAGNAMYYLPLRVLLSARDKIPLERLLKAYEVYVEEMIAISFGQGTDIAWHRGIVDEITEEQYLQMCALKTGTLARMSAKLAGVLAGADPKTIAALGAFAEALGVAFQIRDDILNLSATSGKGHFVAEYIGEDIREGKRSLLVIHTLRKAVEKDRKRLIEILNSHTSDRSVIQEAIEIIKKYGAFEYAAQRAVQIVQNAWKTLDPLLPQSAAKDTLRSLAEFAISRGW